MLLLLSGRRQCQGGGTGIKEGKKLIDEIARAGFKIMIFSGGEPLMCPDIFELVAYAAFKKAAPGVWHQWYDDYQGSGAEAQESRRGALGISLDSLNEEEHNAIFHFSKTS